MKTKVQVQRISSKMRLTDLKAFVNLCFGCLENDDETVDLKEIANKTRLSLTTIWRLRTNQFTLAVRYDTIQRLGYSAGLKLTYEEGRALVALTD